jgi:uncharacterized protein
VLLRRPPDSPDVSDDELDAIHGEHLAHLRHVRVWRACGLRSFGDQADDVPARAVCLHRAAGGGARLAESDQAVRKRGMSVDVLTSLVAAGEIRLGAA